jgi:hypothetical protein
MSTLTGQKIANTYKQLLQVSTDNSGLSATVQTVQDGAGTNSALQLSNSTVNINGTFQLSGSTLTATAAELNAIADLTGTTGIVAVSAGQVYGRTLTAGTGVSITNADGTEGNPTIALNPSGVAAGSYGPLSNIAVNSVGQVVSISTETSVSVSVINASSFIGEYLNLSANASIVGDVNIDGNTSIGGSVWINGPVSIVDSLYVGTNLSVTGNTKTDFLYAVSAEIGDLRADTLTFSAVSVSAFTANTLSVVNNLTGVSATFSDNVSVATLNAGTNIYIAGSPVALASSLTATSLALATSIDTANTRITSVSDFAVALSATFATSINNSNTNIAAVSALTSVNLESITSINSVINNLDFATSAELAATSLALATSIGTANTRITSVSDFAVALSATFATSINNSNTNITINANAITSINAVVAGVSVLTSINAAAITSINAIIEGDVSADSGTFNTLTVITSASVGGTFNVGGNVGIGSTGLTKKLEVNAGAVGPIATFTDGVATNFTLKTDGSSVGTFGTEAGGTQLALMVANSEKVRIDSSGNVGIGTTSPSGALQIVTATATTHNRIYQTNSGGDAYDSDIYASTTNRSWIYGAFDTAAGFSNGGWCIHDATAAAYRLVINSSGNVGIGTTAPTEKLSIVGNVTITGSITSSSTINSGGDIRVTGARGSTLANGLQIDASAGGRFNVGSSEAYTFQRNGTTAFINDSANRLILGHNANVTMANVNAPAQVHSTGANLNVLQYGNNANGSNLVLGHTRSGTVGTVGTILVNGDIVGNIVWCADDGTDLNSTVATIRAMVDGVPGSNDTPGRLQFETTASGNAFSTERMRITSAGNVGIGTGAPTEKLDVVGNVTISGSITKGSGSFRIDHPIKPNTHHLVHSFVEAPTADNIYRGTVTLIGGAATVNLDTAARLTSGTFEALNTNVDCWVSNKSGWTAVQGNVEGAMLTITAQDSNCTDTVSWLVIGERHDQTIIDANWTDANGRVITEPKKEKGVI